MDVDVGLRSIDNSGQPFHAFLVPPVTPSWSLAAWWGIAEADSAVLGLGVAALMIGAIAYVVTRAQRLRSARRRPRRSLDRRI